MKKKLRALYMLIAAAVVLSAGIFMLRLSPRPLEGEPDGDAEAPCTVTDFPVGSVNALAITNSKNSIGLLVRGENVELILADSSGALVSSEIDASQSELRSLVYMLCHISGTRELPMPEDRDACGFSSPNANLSFIFTDGTKREYLMGSEIAGDRGYYLFDLGANRLFIIDGKTAALLERSEQDLVSHSVFPTVATSEYKSVGRISFERNGESFIIENTDGDFRFTYPIDQRIRAYNVYSSLIAPLGGIYADSCIAAGADISEYGFDSAEVSVEMCVSGKTYKALFLTSGEDLLMAEPESGNVYTVDRELLKLLPDGYMSLLDGKPYYYSLGDCREVRVIGAERELIFEISGSGKDIGAVCGGRKLDADAVSALSQSVNGVEIAGRAEGEAEGESVLTIYFDLNDGRREEVRLIKDGEKYFCAVNGRVNFTVTSLSVGNLTAALEEYLTSN